jgi:hypothetical protein
MSDITVQYNGKYPNACSGTLAIQVDGKTVYNKAGACHSTGGVWFDDEWNDYVCSGVLKWDDAEKFSQEIQNAVRTELVKVQVCCGGCI